MNPDLDRDSVRQRLTVEAVATEGTTNYRLVFSYAKKIGGPWEITRITADSHRALHCYLPGNPAAMPPEWLMTYARVQAVTPYVIRGIGCIAGILCIGLVATFGPIGAVPMILVLLLFVVGVEFGALTERRQK